LASLVRCHTSNLRFHLLIETSLIPLILYLLLPIILAIAYKGTVKKPAQGSDLNNVMSIVKIAFTRNFSRFFSSNFWDAAKPSVLISQGVTTLRGKEIPWSDEFVDDVARTFNACQIFLFFPIFNLNDGGIGAIQSSQVVFHHCALFPGLLIKYLGRCYDY
jgi:hypothetical protein